MWHVTCDMWHVTCDMWHVTNNNFFTHHVAYFWIPYNLRSSQEYTICNKWQVTSDMWHVTCDMWHVTCDMWHVTSKHLFTHHVAYFRIPYGPRSSQEYTICNMWHVTCDMWHVTCDMWQKTTVLPIMLHIFGFIITPGVHKSIPHVIVDNLWMYYQVLSFSALIAWKGWKALNNCQASNWTILAF